VEKLSFGLIPGWEPTIETVRHYSIKMMDGFSTFTCPLCKHSVTTRDFSSQNGNCRTQAAKTMNEHAAAVHGRHVSLYAPNTPMERGY
jgi:hypothetical protein